MPENITVYTLEELKAAAPAAYSRVHKRWCNLCMEDADIPWSSETMDSLKATISACGATLLDWQIGAEASGPNSLSVRVEDDRENGKPKDARWFANEVLRPLSKDYFKKNGHVWFPGNCPFTGYCADEDFLEAVYKSLKVGRTLTAALESLAAVAGSLMENDLQQHMEEESMLANWGSNVYTIEGVKV